MVPSHWNERGVSFWRSVLRTPEWSAEWILFFFRSSALIRLLVLILSAAFAIISVVAALETVGSIKSSVEIIRKSVPSNYNNADISGQVFDDLDLSKTNFSGAKARNTQFVNTTLFEAKFHGADLSGANLTGANLTRSWLMHTKFNGAILIGTIFSGADTYKADFSGAILSGADLSEVLPGKLDKDQLLGACGDLKTKVPNGVIRPPNCAN
tara:strand:+ start:643 stop:1275 length:633 start_codon:yes stop_codon:yes gene_type:complete